MMRNKVIKDLRAIGDANFDNDYLSGVMYNAAMLLDIKPRAEQAVRELSALAEYWKQPAITEAIRLIKARYSV